MKTTHARLALEAAEDRVTPSRGWDHAGPRPDHGPAVLSFPPPGDHADGFRDLPRPHAGPDPSRDRFELIVLRPNPPRAAVETTNPTATTPEDERATASETRGTAAETRETAAVEVAAPVVRTAAVVRETPAARATTAVDRGVAAALSDRVPVAVAAPAPTPLQDRSADGRPLPPAGDKPAAAVEATWPVLFVGTVPEMASPRPEPETSTPDAPTKATPLEEAPAPSLVERAIEAVLPAGTPLHGVLPLAGEWIEAGAADLLDGLENLTADVADVPVWEQMTWLAGAVLVFGGVTYTVGTRRGRRRPDRAVIGTDSALASWEDKHARRAPG